MSEFGWSPLDVAASPVYSILEGVSNLPGVNQTQFGNWLNDSNIFQGARNFRDEQPGWATGVDIASSFIPYIGWGSALNKARAGAGLLGAVNSAGRSAAALAPRNAPLAFALGETVRYAPISAAITGFDLASGQYENPLEALVSFGLGSVGGAALQAGGHALSPFVTRVAPSAIGGAWRAAFEPGPELAALYGFDNNVRRAAADAAAIPAVQEAFKPAPAQVRAGAIWDILQTPPGTHPPEVLDILRGQYDTEVRSIFNEQLDPSATAYRFESGTSMEMRRAIDQLTRPGVVANGAKRRVLLNKDGNNIRNPDVLAARLGLPGGWAHDTSLPGITEVDFTTPASTEHFRRQIGLDMTRAPADGWRRLERDGPFGRQTWAIRPEAGTKQWLVTTEVPVAPGMGPDAHHVMKGADGNANTPAKKFFAFKTHNPSKFFPHMRADFDVPDGAMIGVFEDRIPKGQSKLLDRLLDFKKIFLNPETIRAAQAAKYGSPQQRQAFIKAILGGPTMGKEIAQLVEMYAMPTQFQLRDNPEARGILSLYQAAFDTAEGEARALLHGVASIPEGSNPLASLFGSQTVDDATALAANLRRVLVAEPSNLDVVRQFIFNDRFDLKSIEGTDIGKWLKTAVDINVKKITDGNNAIEALRKAGATTAKPIPMRKNHIGVSRKWDGSVFIPIYAEGSANPIAIRAGNGKAQAEQKAKEWIDHFSAKDGKPYRAGQAHVMGQSQKIPSWLTHHAASPGLLEPRRGMRGYEYEFEPIKHVDDLLAMLEDGYVVRGRYIASTIADALSGGKLNQLRANDSKAWQTVNTRIMQLKGQPGPLEARMNQIVDSALAPALGTGSFSKISDGFNEFNFHMLHGVGNVATPLLNLTSVLQTQLPSAANFLSADINTLKGMGFQIPAMSADGMPTRGFNWITDPTALLRGGFKKASSSDPEVQEIYNVLFNRKIMGTGLANEYTGQDRTLAARASEGIRSADDIGYWLKRGSSLMMSKTEQISRTLSAGMALKAMDMMEAATGAKFTIDQKIANAARFVEQTNFGYFASDRPQMFTTPLGAVFGNQKTWMTNYLFMMAEYMGLAKNGNWAPLLMTLGTTAGLGGVFAVPFAGQAIDAITETFAGQDAKEYIFENLGEGGNAISFGLPAMFGMSLTGNVSAPGSNLAHDTEFFFTLIALERAKLMGRAVGRTWDDQVTLGMNPLQDELFVRQSMQAFTPRAVYRTWEAMQGESLHSAATGYPLVNNLGWGARVMHSLGFRETDIAIQYAAYESLLADKAGMSRKISLFGEAYANAMVNNDRAQMADLLQQAGMQGLDVSRVMMSARTRLRNQGLDMFGRNFNGEQLERYQETLSAGGRE